MEKAYAELYREFLQLRSLCLKQAALLQQLTQTLRRQQGDLGRLRLDFAHPGTERKEVLKAAPLRPLDLPGANGEVAPSSVSGDSKQAGRFWGDDTTRQMFRMTSACGSFLDSEFLSQTGGMMLMSEVAVQSQVCDFCNAVFPGYTTTRGDFLRHLHTHIT
ncbi:uncharacterized protein zgc:113184 isoform X2 [Coregonus clupeaformis]|uniref:uncharacterized protein zgc:113184 isoform X2 n=1 Tax=Coregonus clupeaformis TaxID=59861 RepID=UPI001BE0C502|nr:uncharacterized protein zgc:113184 isoform X2 [Coregonus clupeaformis]